MPISCHFQGYKALLATSLSCKQRYSKYRTLHILRQSQDRIWNGWGMPVAGHANEENQNMR